MSRQNGFTLIELIMVIVILGILSAFALPRFFDVSAEARAARINAALGAARVAVANVHAYAQVKGVGFGENDPNIFFEGSEIQVKFGYPATPFALLAAAGLDADFRGAGNEGGITHADDMSVEGGKCGFRYIPPSKLGDAPQFLPLSNSGSLPVTAADCRRN